MKDKVFTYPTDRYPRSQFGDIGFIDTDIFSRSLDRANKAHADNEQTQLENQYLRGSMPTRLQQLTANLENTTLGNEEKKAEKPYWGSNAEAEATRKREEAEQKKITTGTMRDEAPYAGPIKQQTLQNLEATATDRKHNVYVNAIKKLGAGDREGAEKDFGTLGRSIRPEVLDDMELQGKLPDIVKRAEAIHPDRPADQQRYIDAAIGEHRKQKAERGRVDPTLGYGTVPGAPKPVEETADKSRGPDITKQIAEREAAARAHGLDPKSAAGQTYVLTGRMPREDERSLSATDKKAIHAAEDDIPVLEQTISTLRAARELNDKTFTGFTANARGYVGARLPTWAGGGSEAAVATDEWGKLMSAEAIQTMADTLKGATTDFELRNFTARLADPSTPPETRKRIIDRMITVAERHQQIKQDRFDQLRGGTYYKPGGGGVSQGNGNRPINTQMPQRPPGVPDNAAYNPGPRTWSAPSGQQYDQNGSPVARSIEVPPRNPAQRVVGQVYTAQNGRRVQWDGRGFLPVVE